METSQRNVIGGPVEDAHQALQKAPRAEMQLKSMEAKIANVKNL